MLASLNQLRKLTRRIDVAKNVAGFEAGRLVEFMTHVLEILAELTVFNKKAQLDRATREVRVSRFLRTAPQSHVQTCLVQTASESQPDLFPSKFILPMYRAKPQNKPDPTRFRVESVRDDSELRHQNEALERGASRAEAV